jgi:hypothetical protein
MLPELITVSLPIPKGVYSLFDISSLQRFSVTGNVTIISFALIIGQDGITPSQNT